MIENHLSDLINQRIIELLGLNFPPSKTRELERGLTTVAKEFGIEPSFDKIYEWLSQPNLGNEELKALSSALTVNETYFFREKPALNMLKNVIIPGLIELRKDNSRSIKIWSAGCSSGEEPYTLAIMLREYFPLLKDWSITILATDISPAVLQKALKGEYSEWSFRETDDTIRKKYFTQHGRHWQIVPEIRKMITFSFLNLSKNSYPSSVTNTHEMDVIFCRNVMMYFSDEVIRQVSARFYSALNPTGWFITSQVELNDDYFGQFARVQLENGIFYRKVPRRAKELVLPTAEVQPEQELPKRIKRPDSKPVSRPTKEIPKPIEKRTEQPSPEVYFNAGRYQLCAEACRKVLEKDKENVQAKVLLAKSLAHLGQLDEAETLIAGLVQKNVSDAGLYYLNALLLSERNDTQQAEEMLRKALYIDASHLHANLMMGRLQQSRGNSKGANMHFRAVLSGIEHFDDSKVLEDFDHMTVGRIREMIERQY